MSYPITAGDVLEAIQAGAREGTLQALANVDFATQGTLAQVLAKLSSDPATAVNQEAAKTVLDALAGKDYATQATLAQALSRLEALENKFESGDAKVTLTGQINEQVVYERRIRNDTDQHRKAMKVPAGATHAVVMLRSYGRTGNFESGEGLNMEVLLSGFAPQSSSHGWGASTETSTTLSTLQQAFIGPGLGGYGDAGDRTWSQNLMIPGVLYNGGYIYVRLNIRGTFGLDEGFDCEVRVLWQM